jgi:hypothetical protein
VCVCVCAVYKIEIYFCMYITKRMSNIRTVTFVSTKELHSRPDRVVIRLVKYIKLYTIINTSISAILLCIVGDSKMDFDKLIKL